MNYMIVEMGNTQGSATKINCCSVIIYIHAGMACKLISKHELLSCYYNELEEDGVGALKGKEREIEL